MHLVRRVPFQQDLKQLSVPFERPRTAVMRMSTEFHRLADEIWTLLHSENTQARGN